MYLENQHDVTWFCVLLKHPCAYLTDDVKGLEIVKQELARLEFIYIIEIIWCSDMDLLFFWP